MSKPWDQRTEDWLVKFQNLGWVSEFELIPLSDTSYKMDVEWTIEGKDSTKRILELVREIGQEVKWEIGPTDWYFLLNLASACRMKDNPPPQFPEPPLEFDVD